MMLRKLEVIYVPLRNFILSKTRSFITFMQQTGKIWGIQSSCSPTPSLAGATGDVSLFMAESLCSKSLRMTLLPFTAEVHELLNLGGRKSNRREWLLMKDEGCLLSKLLESHIVS